MARCSTHAQPPRDSRAPLVGSPRVFSTDLLPPLSTYLFHFGEHRRISAGGDAVLAAALGASGRAKTFYRLARQNLLARSAATSASGSKSACSRHRLAGRGASPNGAAHLRRGSSCCAVALCMCMRGTHGGGATAGGSTLFGFSVSKTFACFSRQPSAVAIGHHWLSRATCQ